MCNRFQMFILLLIFLVPAPLLAQEMDSQQQAGTSSSNDLDTELVMEEDNEVSRHLESLASLLENREELQNELASTAQALKKSDNRVQETQLQEKAEGIRNKIDALDKQIDLLATGISRREFELQSAAELNLEEEVKKLLRPLVIMLQSVTADAREIENLRFELSTVKKQETLARQALERLQPLIEQSDDKQVAEELNVVYQTWEKRLDEALNKKEAVTHQLNTYLEERDVDSGSAAQGFWEFLSLRGRNLAFGIIMFVLVFFLVRIIGGFLVKLQTKQNGVRGFGARLTSLIVNVLSVVAALFSTLMVFNFVNDWLLTAIVLLALFALVWSLLKMLPTLIEQVTLLLNLGAVQEGERVIYNGIPWRVKKLDFYSEFENCSLTGGQFTVPVRELVGLHSRPSGKDEAYFPCEQGDWLELQDGVIGQVKIQTPGYVEIVELGGAKHTYPTDAFLAQIPKNLSVGYRVEVEFGIDYSHQSIATYEVIVQMAEFVKRGVLKKVSKDELISVEVEMIRAGASSLDYIVEAEFTGSTAERYEELEREVVRLLVECCNQNGWIIPFQQVVLHNAD